MWFLYLVFLIIVLVSYRISSKDYLNYKEMMRAEREREARAWMTLIQEIEDERERERESMEEGEEDWAYWALIYDELYDDIHDWKEEGF